MTPRRDIVWLDVDEPPEIIGRTIANSAHALFPVGQGSLDNLLGVANVKELLKRSLAGQSLDLKAVLQPPLLTPEAMPALKVLELFKRSGQGLALVIDEYGGVQGLVTRTDILEALAGDMPVAGEPAEAQAVQRADGSWLLDGTLLIDEFKEHFRIERLPGERRAGYQTVGGFAMSQMGHIPATGESFVWRNLRFEVMDMDGRRVDKVLVTPQPPGSTEPPQTQIPEEANFNA
ncbi:MAG: hemolysin family protein [Chloroflexota bacterium]